MKLDELTTEQFDALMYRTVRSVGPWRHPLPDDVEVMRRFLHAPWTSDAKLAPDYEATKVFGRRARVADMNSNPYRHALLLQWGATLNAEGIDLPVQPATRRKVWA